MKEYMKRNRFWLFAILGTVCFFLNISCSDALNFKQSCSFLAANVSWPTMVLYAVSITRTLSQNVSVIATVVNDSVVGSPGLLKGKVEQPKSARLGRKEAFATLNDFFCFPFTM